MHPPGLPIFPLKDLNAFKKMEAYLGKSGDALSATVCQINFIIFFSTILVKVKRVEISKKTGLERNCDSRFLLCPMS